VSDLSAYVVRAARGSDLDALYNMAKTTGGGFTNLPASKPALRRKLDKALASFARDGDEPGDDQFLFVLENTATARVVGTCQVFSRTGSERPFHSYRLGEIERHSDALGRSFKARTLTFCTDLDGLSEVGGLFLHPHERAAGIGKLLARSRYLFIALHRARFAERTIAELRGAHDAVGRSPFLIAPAPRRCACSRRKGSPAAHISTCSTAARR
jgi:arginine N-succinyltransferase